MSIRPSTLLLRTKRVRSPTQPLVDRSVGPFSDTDVESDCTVTVFPSRYRETRNEIRSRILPPTMYHPRVICRQRTCFFVRSFVNNTRWRYVTEQKCLLLYQDQEPHESELNWPVQHVSVYDLLPGSTVSVCMLGPQQVNPDPSPVETPLHKVVTRWGR